MSPLAPSWPAGVKRVLETLESAGYEAYLVGGSVRNWLLGRPIADFDVATDALPTTVVSLFERTVPTGIKHGTVTVLQELPIEVTTYRVEAEYSDGRRPDRVAFARRIEEDMARRDFTMNAIAMDLMGHRVDPYGGAGDIERGVIRSVRDPDERFEEDGLRILRGFRFASELGFSIEPATRAGMTRQADQLRLVSAERVGQELSRVTRSNWAAIVRYWADGPWLDALPEPWSILQKGFQWLDGHPQLTQRWAFDVGDRSEDAPATLSVSWTSSQAVPRTVYRCVAAVATWLKCAKAPRGTGRRLSRAVRWPNQTAQLIDQVETVASTGLDVTDLKRWRHMLFEFDPWAVWTWCCIEDWLQQSRLHRDQFLSAASTQPLFQLRDLAVNGEDLLRIGFEGARLGDALRVLCEAVLMGVVTNEQQPLLDYVRHYIADEGRL